jgi:hypothetical protein
MPDKPLGKYTDADIIQDSSPTAPPAPEAAQPDQGAMSSFGQASGLTGLKNLVMHPIDSLSKIPGGLVDEGNRVGSQLKEAWNTPNNEPMKAIDRTLYSIPFLGSSLKKADEQAASGNYRGAIGSSAGILTSLLAPGVAKGSGALESINPMAKVFPKSLNLTPAVSGARGMAKALQIPEEAQRSFIPAATEEAGTVMDYAERNNLPINGTYDLVKAAEGAAQEVQDFIDKKVVAPNADKHISVAGVNFRGRTFGEGPNTTVGAANERINAITTALKPNFRNGLASQISAANVSDADLIAEKQALTNRLHSTLAKATGLQPEDIASLRQRAGKLRTIADETSLADAGNLRASGNAAAGKSPLGSGGKIGLMDRGLQAIQGGPEIIGNRAIKSALKDIVPRNTPFPELSSPEPISAPRPAPITGRSTPFRTFDATPDPAAANAIIERINSRNQLRDLTAASNRVAADQEFLKSNELEQSAQDAAAQRSARAEYLRESKRATAAAERKLEGEAARTIGRDRARSGGR